MRRTTRIAFVALGCGALLSCEGRAESGDNSEAAVDESGKTSSELLDMPCGSLEPLLALLPSAQTVGDMREAFRHCDPGAFGVSVGYGQRRDRFSGYEFTVKVLDGNSPYAASPLNPHGAGEGARAVLTQVLANAVGALHRAVDGVRMDLTQQSQDAGRAAILAKGDVDRARSGKAPLRPEVSNLRGLLEDAGIRTTIFSGR